MPNSNRPRLICCSFLAFLWTLIFVVPESFGQAPSGGDTQARFDDHQNMMDQLGITKLRPGHNGQKQTGEGFEEETANPYKDTMPDALTMKDGTKVTQAAQWPKRRAEIVEDFEREIYGRIPENVPKVTWEVTRTTEGNSGGIPTITKTLVGHVDNSGDEPIKVNIQASFTVPANAIKPVPILIEFGGGFGGFGGRGPGGPSWTEQAISHGWGYGNINPGSIQGDNNQLRAGIIGLTNKGEPRKPEDWGALRAWQWGVSRLIDYFEANPDSKVDPKKVGVEGVSRYGKASIVAEAFEPRVAVAFVASSGEGGVKLHRHIFGEAVENLTGGEYYWMGGNFLKYGAAEPFTKTAADMPVDSHELIALCAPRPVFISYGVEPGDPKWVDAHGSFMAGVLAGPVYKLLGKRDFGLPGDYLTAPMPAVGQLVGGELAWRQHEGGHSSVPNFPAFFDWVSTYVKAEPLPASAQTPAVGTDAPSKAAEPKASDSKPAAPKSGEAAATPPPAPPRVNSAIVPRLNQGFMAKHNANVEVAKKGDIDLLFMGDSITDFWRNGGRGGAAGDATPLAGKPVFDEFYGAMKTANFGIAGDTTQGVLWRLQNGEGEGYKPKAIMLMIGTNNTSARNTPTEIAMGVAAVVFELRKDFPDAKILLLGIFPRSGANAPVRAQIAEINKMISTLNDNSHIIYQDIGSKFLAEDGSIPKDVMADGLHPTTKGYRIWAEAVKEPLENLMK